MTDDVDDSDRARLGELAATVYHALGDQDWDGAAELIEQNWPLVTSYRISLVRAVADALPDEFLNANSRWLGIRRYLQFMLVSDRIRPTGYPSATARRIAPQPLVDLLVDLTGQSITARTDGRFADAARLAGEALTTMRQAPDDRDVSLSPMAATMTFQWGLSLRFAGQLDAAADVYHLCYGLATGSGNARIAAEAAGEAAWVDAIAGRGVAADLWIERARQFAAASAQKRLRPSLHFAVASRSFDLLDYPAGFAALTEISDESNHEFRALLAAVRALYRPAGGESGLHETLSLLDAELEAMPSAISRTGHNAAFIAYARSFVFTYAGQPERALTEIEEATQRGIGAMLPTRRASVRYLLGSFAAAESDADAVISTATGTPRLLVGALVVKAASALHRSDTATAASVFTQAVNVAAANRMVVEAAVSISQDDFGALLALTDAGTRHPELQAMAREPSLFPPASAPTALLTGQERHVLEELAGGDTLRVIAERLLLSTNTVKAHTRAIYRKLGVGDRAAMEAEARRRGLI